MYNSGNSSKNVTGSSIVDGTVETADIADDAVTVAKLANAINTDIATGVTASITAGDALPKSGGAMTGAITNFSSTGDLDTTSLGVALGTGAGAGQAMAIMSKKIVITTAFQDVVLVGLKGGYKITVTAAESSVGSLNYTGYMVAYASVNGADISQGSNEDKITSGILQLQWKAAEGVGITADARTLQVKSASGGLNDVVVTVEIWGGTALASEGTAGNGNVDFLL